MAKRCLPAGPTSNRCVTRMENKEDHSTISPTDLPNISHLPNQTKRPNLAPEIPKLTLMKPRILDRVLEIQSVGEERGYF